MDTDRSLGRRKAIQLTGIALIAAGSGKAASAEMPYRPLGETGVMVSCIGMGGFHIGGPKVNEGEGIRMIRQALDRGMNFMDNCWDYNDGRSEIVRGTALRDGYRSKAFLMTKFDGRTKESALKQIDESLKRLQTDHVDLLQFHENIRLTIRTVSLRRAGRLRPHCKPSEKAKPALSVSQDTRIPGCIYT